MKVKQKIIKQAINKIETRLKKLDHFFNDPDPLLAAFDCQKKAYDILKDNKGNYSEISRLIKPLAKQKKEFIKAAKYKNKNYMKFMDEESDLKHELSELKQEQYFDSEDFKKMLRS